jgi:hypothetical protein
MLLSICVLSTFNVHGFTFAAWLWIALHVQHSTPPSLCVKRSETTASRCWHDATRLGQSRLNKNKIVITFIHATTLLDQPIPSASASASLPRSSARPSHQPSISRTSFVRPKRMNNKFMVPPPPSLPICLPHCWTPSKCDFTKGDKFNYHNLLENH